MRSKQKSLNGYSSKSGMPSGDAISKSAKTCPYNPEEPLTIPPKMALEDQEPSFVRPRKFTIVGPLVQDVCEKLNIPHEECLDTSIKVICEMINVATDHTSYS